VALHEHKGIARIAPGGGNAVAAQVLDDLPVLLDDDIRNAARLQAVGDATSTRP
jgi:hypothetical protein